MLTPVTNMHMVIDSGSTQDGRLHLQAADGDPGEEGAAVKVRDVAAGRRQSRPASDDAGGDEGAGDGGRADPAGPRVAEAAARRRRSTHEAGRAAAAA